MDLELQLAKYWRPAERQQEQGGQGWGFLGLTWSPDGSKFTSCCSEDKTVVVRDASNGKELHTLKGHEGRVRVFWISDGAKLASIDDTTVKFWDSASGSQIDCIRGPKGCFNSVAWSPDESKLANWGLDEGQSAVNTLFDTGIATVRVWDTTSGKQIHCIKAPRPKIAAGGQKNSVYEVKWSPDGAKLACATDLSSDSMNSISCSVWSIPK